MPPAGTSPIAFVLAGGAARGAYEVGVVSYAVTEIARELGRPVPVDIFCGTSVGAINACMLAASADDVARGAQVLVDTWRSLRLENLVRPNRAELTDLVRSMVSLRRSPLRPDETRR